MRRLTLLWGVLLSFCAMTPIYAATLTVTTDQDEANCNCSGAGCSPNAACVRTTGSFKLSTEWLLAGNTAEYYRRQRSRRRVIIS